MKYFDWDPEKSQKLQEERGVGFEEVLVVIGEGRLLDIAEHPNQALYPSQKMFIVQIQEYVYLVPFVEDEQKIFLKTIIPSRKAPKRYLQEK